MEKQRAITLAHYTSAEVVLEMLKNQNVWMRNARCMNDFSEVDYPITIIHKYFSDANRSKDFRDACDKCHIGVFETVDSLLNGHLPSIYNETYITCLSEHHRRDDANGRLSMWRGYGGSKIPAAIVVRKEATLGEGPYGLSGFPVQYLAENAFFSELDRRKGIMLTNRTSISRRPPNEFRNSLFGMFQVLIATTKHPGFKEEKEWRLLYLPKLYPSNGLEQHKAQQTINGMPQSIYKIPVDGEPINDGTALTVDSLVERIILGPCTEAGVAIEAIREQLRSAGHRNPEKAVHFCGIPYREKI
ncbi:hypothetical protein ASD50_18505 [Mesorhizobium sp. Root552]|nr:hypothetical protein ASD50_18505 [Mesorhizobium sp. Root552]